MNVLNGVTGKRIGWICAVLVFLFGSTMAQAAGVDTSSTSLNSLKTWLDTWIPLLCTIALMVTCILWWMHVVRADFAVRGATAMIGAGSAAYIISFFF